MLTLTNAIVLITVLTSFGAWQNAELFDKFKLNSYAVYHKKEFWRLITCTLIHADYIHLAFNMFSFYSIGNKVEEVFVDIFPDLGKLYYLGLYVLGAVFSCFSDIYKYKNNPGYNSIGASGAVSAVIFSFVVIAPMDEINIFFIPMKAVIYGAFFLAIEYYLSKKSMGNVNHGAHFEGALFGIIYTILCKPDLISHFFSQIMG